MYATVVPPEVSVTCRVVWLIDTFSGIVVLADCVEFLLRQIRNLAIHNLANDQFVDDLEHAGELVVGRAIDSRTRRPRCSTRRPIARQRADIHRDVGNSWSSRRIDEINGRDRSAADGRTRCLVAGRAIDGLVVVVAKDGDFWLMRVSTTLSKFSLNGSSELETVIVKSSNAEPPVGSVAVTRTLIVPMSPTAGVPVNARVGGIKRQPCRSAAAGPRCGCK